MPDILEIDRISAPLLRNHRSAETEFRTLRDDVPVKCRARIGDAVALQRNRPQLLFCKCARLQLPRALFVVKREIHVLCLLGRTEPRQIARPVLDAIDRHA